MVVLLGAGLGTVILIIVIYCIPSYARLIRTQTLSLKSRDFIRAEEAMNASLGRILFIHLLPNVVGPLLILACLDISTIITLEAGLSFLGLGVKPQIPSWGNILSDGFAVIRTTPVPVIAGGMPLILATIGFTFFGEALRDAAAEYEAAHIPGAVFMDLAELRDTASDLPMMLPSAEKFASRMQSLGLGDGSRIVLYDNSPLHTAARAWWMLRTFGAHDVAILDGGLAKWQAEGRPTASGKETLRHRHFTVWADDSGVRTLDQMKANIDSGAEQVVDARSAARFTGEEPDPRP
eukprot:gene13790-18274_t